ENFVVQHAMALALGQTDNSDIPEPLDELPERLSAIEATPRLRISRSHSTPSIKLSDTSSDSARESIVDPDVELEINTSPKQERSQSLPHTKTELLKRNKNEIQPLTPLSEVCVSTASIQLSIADSLCGDITVKWRKARER
ncbi:hypothetical protein PFISCL1PPCAC_28173, partial [Pristionchus fissidentatus]